MHKKPIILGIETSCDDCSLALLEGYDKVHVHLSRAQHDVHQRFRGIVPELASRGHIKTIYPLFKELQSKAQEQGIQLARDLTAIAVSNRPGLSGPLLVGVQFAKGLAIGYGIPVMPVDHILAHFFSYRLEHKAVYPAIACVVSGGHTLFAYARSPQDIEIVGRTLDDACGEAFDKLASFYELGYPGGQIIDKLAQDGNPRAAKFTKMPIPRDSYDISFSGLKTAATIHRERYWNKDYEFTHQNLCASFSHAAVAMIVDRVRQLLLSKGEKGIKTVVFGGGVSANSLLRSTMKQLANELAVEVVFPSLEYCVDNAAMIACLGCYMYQAVPKESWNLDFGVRSRVSDYRS